MWVQLVLALIVVVASLLWHRRQKPYAYLSQNALESGLLLSMALLLLLAMPYHAAVTLGASETTLNFLKALMIILVGVVVVLFTRSCEISSFLVVAWTDPRVKFNCFTSTCYRSQFVPL